MPKRLLDAISDGVNRLSVNLIFTFYNSFIIGVCLLLSNVLLISCILFVKLTFETLIIYILPIFLFGPSISAAFSCGLKIGNSKDKKITFRQYFNKYKQCFRKSTKLSLIYTVIMLLGIFDELLLGQFSSLKSIQIPILITILFLISSMFFAYRIQLFASESSISSIIWEAIIFSYHNVFSTILIGAILVALFALIIASPVIALLILFGFSIILILSIVEKRIFILSK